MPWAKGVSGNPGGRPRLSREVLRLAKVDSEEAYMVLRDAMRDPLHKQQIAAAITILRLTGAFRSADLAAEAEDTAEAPALPVRPYTKLQLMAAAKGDS